MFFTSLKGSSATVQLFVYIGFLGVLATEMVLRGVLSDESEFDLPAPGNLTRYEKAVMLRVWLGVYITAALIVGAFVDDSEEKANLTSSYFNALLLQQQDMQKLLMQQAEAIEELKAKKR